jgi:hypothetical protein
MICNRNILTQRLRIVNSGARRIQNLKFWEALLILVVLTGILTLPPAISSLMNNVVINSFGQISTTTVWAKSGSPEHIQAAVDTVEAVGGGTVHVPEGTFYWNGETVEISGEVNIIGAGPAGCDGHPNFNVYTAKTILHNNKVPPFNWMFYIDGSNHKPTRISGIQFEATAPVRNDNVDAGDAIRAVLEVTDLRVDHCTFINFAHIAVSLRNTYTGTARAVVDHCVIDNPYKLGSGSWAWAYGFYPGGQAYWWDDVTAPITDFLGKYPVKTGYPVMYVEDCKISRTRHAVDGIQGAWIVARHNYIDHPYQTHYGQLNVHGCADGGWPSARGFEFYNNIVVGEPGNFAELTWLRGGAGMVFNNSFSMSSGYAIGLYEETCPQQPDEILHDVWIWGNTVSGGTLIDNYGGFTENVDYFLRAPNQEQDGFTYTPYPYPHPLTLE